MLSDSVYAHDARHAAKCNSFFELNQNQRSSQNQLLNVRNVLLDVIRCETKLESFLLSIIENECNDCERIPTLVFDGVFVDDTVQSLNVLKRLLSGVDSTVAMENVLFVGSTGLALPFAKVFLSSSLSSSSSSSTSKTNDVFIPHSNTLFLLGSACQTTREQSDLIVSQTTLLEIDAERTDDQCTANLVANNKSVLIRPKQHTLSHDQQRRHTDATRILTQLTLLAQHLLLNTQFQFGVIVCSGGETARHVIDHLDVSRVCVAGELEPGLPWLRLNIAGVERDFVVKAGGFGTPRVLQTLIKQ